MKGLRHVGLRRVLQLRTVLTAHGSTLSELAQRFAVSERTIRRDLALLHDVGDQILWQSDGARRPAVIRLRPSDGAVLA